MPQTIQPFRNLTITEMKAFLFKSKLCKAVEPAELILFCRTFYDTTRKYRKQDKVTLNVISVKYGKDKNRKRSGI